jgi:Protein of unknown function (DUF3485)
MMRIVPLLAAAGLLVVAAVTHGLRTDRWGPPGDLVAAAAQLEHLPLKIGGWEGAPLEVDARQIAAAQVAGHLSRRYVHRSTGAEVSILILCGRPGPVSVHTPDVCYGGAGYQAGPIEKRQLARGDTTWTALFTKSGPAPDWLRINWTWNDGSGWQAADTPRVSFARSKLAYKLYVVRRCARPDEPLEGDPSLDFLTLLLPELQSCLSIGS